MKARYKIFEVEKIVRTTVYLPTGGGVLWRRYSNTRNQFAQARNTYPASRGWRVTCEETYVPQDMFTLIYNTQVDDD